MTRRMVVFLWLPKKVPTLICCKTFSHWFLATSLWYPLVWFSCVYLAWIALCLLILQAAFFCWGDSFIKFEPILAIIFFFFWPLFLYICFFWSSSQSTPLPTPQNSISSVLDYPVISRRPPKLWSFVYLCVCGFVLFFAFFFLGFSFSGFTYQEFTDFSPKVKFT